MANASILAAFERMWQHVVVALNNKSDTTHTHSANDIGALRIINGAEITAYGIDAKEIGTDCIVNATIEQICSAMPNKSRFVLPFTGSATATDGSYRFGTIGAQLPDGTFCSLIIDKLTISRCNLHATHYSQPIMWDGVWTTSNNKGFSGWSLGGASAYEYSTVDLVAGSSALTTGKQYLVYE